MLDFLYLNGWGPFVVTLIFVVPFTIVFVYVVYHRSQKGQETLESKPKSLSRLEGVWIGIVAVLFIAFNFLSIGYMPTIKTANAAASGQPIQQIDVIATSWSYDISNRQIQAGTAVRFSAKSNDTMHGFAVYHPDGDVLFTMMLMPGLETATSIIHTFDEPGTYTVRCLEYCGIAHHAMRDELTVVRGTI
mgnify:CR=1 FL=1